MKKVNIKHEIIIIVAMVLAAIALTCLGALAYLQYALNGDFIYMGIFVFGLGIISFFFYQINKINQFRMDNNNE